MGMRDVDFIIGVDQVSALHPDSRLIRRSVRTRHLYALHGFYDYLQERRTLQGRVAPATLTPYLHPLEHLTSAALIRAILTKQTLHSPSPILETTNI
ncbi:hypothetical protein TNCV_463921 [Trichonephila clavipes]|nr:hypothetical protein TNCV_463921 [Trichonephila clavipes]